MFTLLSQTFNSKGLQLTDPQNFNILSPYADYRCLGVLNSNFPGIKKAIKTIIVFFILVCLCYTILIFLFFKLSIVLNSFA